MKNGDPFFFQVSNVQIGWLFWCLFGDEIRSDNLDHSQVDPREAQNPKIHEPNNGKAAGRKNPWLKTKDSFETPKN